MVYLTFYYILTLATCAWAQAGNEDVVKAKLFTESGLSSEETLNLLKELSASDKLTEMNDELFELLEANNIGKNKCNLYSFLHLNLLLQDLEEDQGNLRRYMSDCIDRQFSLCKPAFAKLFESVDQLTVDDKRKAELLRSLIEEAQSSINNDEGQISYQTMSEAHSKFYEGILKFIELQVAAANLEASNGETVKAENGREKFEEQFDQTVGDLCHQVTLRLERGMMIFKLINPFDHLHPDDDKSLVSWIQINTICEEILDSDAPYTVSDGVYMKLSQRH